MPVLRLPFADPGPSGAGGALPEGFVTAVELPLRDDAAVELVTRLLTETGPALLLALPALTHVEITAGGATRLLTAVHDGDRSTVTVNGVPSAWRVAGAGGELDQALLADRPAEERVRTSWSVRWAVPVDSGPVEPDSGRSATACRRDGCPWGSPPSCTRRRRPTSRSACPPCCSRRSR